MAVVVWNRTERDVVRVSGRTLVFANSTDANTHLSRLSVVASRDKQHPAPIFDLLTVT